MCVCMYDRRWARSSLVDVYDRMYERRWVRSPLVDAYMIGGGQGLLM